MTNDEEIIRRLDKLWISFLNQLHNQLLLTQTTGEVDKEALERLEEPLNKVYTILVGRLEKCLMHGDRVIIEKQKQIVRESYILLNEYNNKKLDALISLREKLEKALKLKLSLHASARILDFRKETDSDLRKRKLVA